MSDPHAPDHTLPESSTPQSDAPQSDAAQSDAPQPRLTLRIGEQGEAVTETIWSQVGGTETFDRIVRRFYDGVKQDPVLAPMYPEDDWEGAIWRLRTFLEQYWGGPTTYSDERGHPRLRMRHHPYRIDSDARRRWLKHMNAALDEAELAPMYDGAIRDYIERAAIGMTNTPG